MVALGVDFGTSHTVAVARWPDGRVRPLLFDGTPLLPSAVFCEETGLVVGRDAVHSARREPSLFEPNPKRRIDEGSVLLGERDVAVQELLIAVFERVLAEFTRTAGGPPTWVTVTHPAGWASTRRKALTDAVLAAGLPKPTLVPEPVAAATYFVRVLRHLVPVGSAVVVYDLGAGTFDGSVVARTAEGFEVRAVGGRDDLGGLDFDEIVLTLLGRSCPPDEWQRLLAPRSVEDARAARLLREEAREAKERLSRSSSVTVMVPLIDADVPLTREEFEAAARPLVERSVRVLTETVRLSQVTSDQIAGIFLVGGASQIPLVATELHRAFGRAPVMIEQPEMVVAEGSVLVGPAVPARDSKPSTALVPTSPPPRHSGTLPAGPGPTGSAPMGPAPAGPAPAGPMPAGSAAAGHGPATGAPGPVSPATAAIAPVSPMPVSPPAQRRSAPPSGPPGMAGQPGMRPVQPYPPMPPRPVYPPPAPVYYPPPQVVYVPTYMVSPIPPRRRPPWTIRWPAGFMKLYSVLLFILVGLALLVQVTNRQGNASSLPDWSDLRQEALQIAAVCAVLGSLLIHAARRLRRGMTGHLWYPVALCGALGVIGAINARGSWMAQALCAVFLFSTILLLLPSAQAWVRKPAKPQPPKAPESDSPEAAAR